MPICVYFHMLPCLLSSRVCRKLGIFYELAPNLGKCREHNIASRAARDLAHQADDLSHLLSVFVVDVEFLRHYLRRMLKADDYGYSMPAARAILHARVALRAIKSLSQLSNRYERRVVVIV